VRRLALLTLVAGALLAGCGGFQSGGGRPSVVATTTQAGDLVRAVGGGRVEVHTILRPNSDPHDYEPRPSVVRAVSRADLVVRSGGEVDDWLGGVLRGAGGRARTLDLIDHVRTERIGGRIDPHWWQDPRNAERALPAIVAALVRVDPRGRSAFRRRAAAYLRRLRALDRGIARCMAAVPPPQRRIVTTHDALGYFAHRYGLTVVGALIPSLSTQAQPSARDIERLVRQIRREHVRAIFPESSINPKLERAVARETGARTGGHLWADALGPPGSSGATYLRSLASNARSLVEGMSGGTRSCRL
jgi:zinc/manganese transport system substrate-binding protein